MKNNRKLLLTGIGLLISVCSLFAQPVNNDCANATTLTPGDCQTMTAATSVLGTQSSPSFTCSGWNDDDVWFRFTATSTSHAVNVVPSVYLTDMVHEVFSGTCGSLTQVTCSDPNYSITDSLTIGVTYYVRVYTYSSFGGTDFEICVSELDSCGSNGTNDFCSTPTTLVKGGAINEVTSLYHTPDQTQIKSTGTGAFCGSIENNSWFEFNATGTSDTFNFTSVTGVNCNLGMQAVVFDVSADSNGCCEIFIPKSNCWDPGTDTAGTVIATGLTTGSSYLLMVDGRFGDECFYTLDGWSYESNLITKVVGTNASCPESSNGSAVSIVDLGFAPYTFAWYDRTTDQKLSVTDSIITGLSPGSYYCVVTDDSMSVDTQYFNISFDNSADVNILEDTMIVYRDYSDTIKTTYNSTGTISWTPSATLDSADVKQPIVSPTQSEWYYVTYNSNGCTGRDSVYVMIITPPLVVTVDSTDLLCAGTSEGSARVTVESGVSPVTFNWYNSDSTLVGSDSVLSNVPSGNYYVIIQDDSSQIDTQYVTIGVTSSPVVEIIKDTMMIDQGEQVVLENTTSDPIDEMIWNPGSSLNDSILHEPIASPSTTTQYTVTYTNHLGCVAYDSVLVIVNQACVLSIPTAITPNGDNLNDVWNIGCIEEQPNAVISVFNRWGTKVFETSGGSNYISWDGTSKSGDAVPVATYYYTIEGIENQEEDRYNGTITIIK